MNLDGSAVLSATPERVWSVLTDPAVLARTIPGCESLQRVGEDSYTLVVSAGVCLPRRESKLRTTYRTSNAMGGVVELVLMQHPRIDKPKLLKK